MEYDGKKPLDFKDERDEDRKIAHALKPMPIDNAMEAEYGRLSDEIA